MKLIIKGKSRASELYPLKTKVVIVIGYNSNRPICNNYYLDHSFWLLDYYLKDHLTGQ